jgi:hypothetical protein
LDLNIDFDKQQAMKMTSTKLKTLYDSDFSLWIEETVNQLKSRDFARVDLENLIEEVETLGKSQRRAMRSFLLRLCEHLLKRCYVEIPECYRGWEIEIRNFRESLELELEDSPSLNDFLVEILPKTYQKALKNVREDYPNIDFPDLCPFLTI